MFRKMPFILMVVIIAVLFLDTLIPLNVKQLLYAISLGIKSVIVTILPFVIFGLLFKSAVILSNGATKIIGLILILVCGSNFLSTFLSHYVGEWIYTFNLSMIAPSISEGLLPSWTIDLPKLVPNDKAMFGGILLGLIASKIQPERSKIIAQKIEFYIGEALKKFVYFIPLFVAGFVVKMQSDGIMEVIIKDYAFIFVIVACAQFGYILLCYFLLNNLRVKESLTNVKNMVPAAVSGFSTMSSAASMPLTIMGTENNVHNKDIARSVIPATVNIHLVGDCFAIPIFAYAVLKSFGLAEPSLLNYLYFTFYFVIAKFSVAAIPGGGIIVMLPILENYMGFKADMLSLITSLYILFDPVITCANVLGNGAFAKMMDKVVQALSSKR